MAASARCDEQMDCRDGSDEQCNVARSRGDVSITLPPAIIEMNGRGDYKIHPVTTFSHCPETHFVCRGTYWSPIDQHHPFNHQRHHGDDDDHHYHNHHCFQFSSPPPPPLSLSLPLTLICLVHLSTGCTTSLYTAHIYDNCLVLVS